MYGKEPRHNEPSITRTSVLTNQILQASNSKMYGKEPRHNEPLYNEDLGINEANSSGQQ